MPIKALSRTHWHWVVFPLFASIIVLFCQGVPKRFGYVGFVQRCDRLGRYRRYRVLPGTVMMLGDSITVNWLEVSSTNIYFSALVGLLLTAAMVAITEYYTSTNINRSNIIAEASNTGHAPM